MTQVVVQAMALVELRPSVRRLLHTSILVVACAGFCAPGARAQGSRKDDVVFNTQGRPMAGATVRICTSSATGQPCSPLANIYSDVALTQTLANPLTTDGLGNYSFYAAPGRYEIEISGPNITDEQFPNVILPNDPSTPTFTTLSTTSGISAFSLSLGGNLTVSGSAAVTGTLTVGGAAIPSTTEANTWTAAQTFQGPSPWADVAAYGARAIVATGYTTTGTITGGSNALSLAQAIVFQNKDGISIYGAGQTSTLTTPSAPTVTASQANFVTGLAGFTVAAPSGAETNSYKIVALGAYPQWGAHTAASPATTISNANALGSQTQTISTLSEQGGILTVTCGASCPLSVGADVTIASTSNDLFFAGQYTVASEISGTEFTVIMAKSTPGAITGTGGTLGWFNCNTLTLPSLQSGQFNYAVYGRTTSGYTLLGFSVPGQLYWNDWGATMSGNLTAYGWLPTTASSSAQNGVLTTTITAGGGTTNVTLAAAAGNGASGAFVTFDDAPGFIATMASDPGETTIYIPPPAFFYNFIIGSYLPMINTTFGLRAAVVHQAGGLYLDDPVEIDNGGAWFGESGYSQEQAQQTYQAASVTVGTAYPGFYLNGSNVELDRLSVSQYPGCNNALLAYANTAGGANNILTWNHSVLQTGTGSCSSNNDYLGIAFYDDGVSFTNLSGDTFNGGPIEAPNLTTTPLVVYQGNVANDTITDSQFDRRGIASARDTTGGGCQILIKGKTWSQGPIEPLYSCNAIQNEIGGVDFESSLLDTSGQPIFANLSGGTFEGTVRIFSANTDSPYNTITGTPVANLTVTDCSTGVSAINGGGFGQNQDYSAECVGLTEPTNATYGTLAGNSPRRSIRRSQIRRTSSLSSCRRFQA